MSPKRIHSVAGLVSIALIAVGCSTGGPTDRPTVPALSPSSAPSGSTPAVSPSVVPSPAVEASASVAAESPSAEPTSVDSEPSGEPMSGTAGPGCGTGQLGFFTHRDEVPDELHFGGATIELTTALIGLRNGTYTADDMIPGGIGLTPTEIAVRVDPGTHIILRGDGMVLTQISAAVVPWNSVDFVDGLGSSSDQPRALDWRTRADGSISVSAPETSGDWMVAFELRWQTPCYQGDGVAYSRIKVNG
jgi:hypothetical protein